MYHQFNFKSNLNLYIKYRSRLFPQCTPKSLLITHSFQYLNPDLRNIAMATTRSRTATSSVYVFIKCSHLIYIPQAIVPAGKSGKLGSSLSMADSAQSRGAVVNLIYFAKRDVGSPGFVIDICKL